MKFLIKLLWYIWLAPTIILLACVVSLFWGCVFMDTIDGATLESALSSLAAAPQEQMFERFWDLFCQIPYIEIIIGIVKSNFDFPAYIVFSDIAQSALVVLLSFLLCRLNMLFRSGKILGAGSKYNLIYVLSTSIKIMCYVGVTVLFYWLESFMNANSFVMWFICFIVMVVSFGIMLLVHLFKANNKFKIVFALVYNLIEILKAIIDAALVLFVVWMVSSYLFSTVRGESNDMIMLKVIGVLVSMPVYLIVSDLLDKCYLAITNSLTKKLMHSSSNLLNV